MTQGFCAMIWEKVDDVDRNREGRMMNATGRQGEKEGDFGCVFRYFAHCGASWA